ncbi:type VII toxin-antitoxin system HepT family RNase toxin [Thalassiella azotivora]
MTPRDLRAGVVQERLATIRLLLRDLESLGEVTADQLEADRFRRHVVEHVLSQLVQLAVSVNSHVAATVLGEAVTDYRSSFDAAASAGLVDADLAAELKPSVGLRNVVVHEYLDVDVRILAAAVPLARSSYGRYLTSVADWLAQRQGGLAR